jgi:peroxiredoxin
MGILAVILPLTVVSQQQPLHTYSIEGTVKGIKEPVAWVYLYHDDGRALINAAKPQGEDYLLTVAGLTRQLSTRSRSYFDRDDVGFVDSAAVVNGSYRIQGIVSGPVKAILVAKPSKGRVNGNGIIFLQPGTMQVAHTDSFYHYTVSNNQAHTAFEQLQKQVKQTGTRPDTVKQLYLSYARNNLRSPIALWALQQYAGGDYALTVGVAAVAEPVFRQLPPAVQQSPLGQRFLMRLEITKLFEQLKPYQQQLDPLNASYYKYRQAKDSKAAEEAERKMKEISDQVNDEVLLPYVKKNAAGPAAMYALQQVVKSYDYPDMGYAKIAPFFQLLPAAVKASVDGSKMAGNIERALQTGEGQQAPDFIQPDTLGKPVQLSLFRGNYVLVDFWASWCAPCRAENPNVVKAWNAYRQKGFKIISVSIDSDNARVKWLKAIHDDGMPWIHVSDLKGWKNAAAQTYGIKAVPSNFLIDPQGKIVGKNLRGEALQAKLAAIYGSTVAVDSLALQQLQQQEKEQRTVYAGQVNRLLQQYDSLAKLDSNRARYQLLQGKYKDQFRRIDEQRDSLSEIVLRKVYADFVREHPQRPVALRALRQYSFSKAADGAYMDSLFHLLPGNVQQSEEGQQVAIRIGYAQLQEAAEPYRLQVKQLMPQFNALLQAKDEEGLKQIRQQIGGIEATMREQVFGAYVRQHPQSPAALYALEQSAGNIINAEKTGPLFASLPVTVQQSAAGKKMAAAIELARQSGIGSLAPDITQKDTAGKMVHLSDFRGKYVLLDFWASWCGPCRAENPALVNAYAQFRSKGFEILSVSLDQPGAKDKWLKAIHDDHLEKWTHVSELNYFDNTAAKAYGIHAIPQNYLVDPSGKIVARNLRGAQLAEKLQQVLGR